MDHHGDHVEVGVKSFNVILIEIDLAPGAIKPMLKERSPKTSSLSSETHHSRAEFAMRPKTRVRAETVNLVSSSAAEESRSDSEGDPLAPLASLPVPTEIPPHVQAAIARLDGSSEEDSDSHSKDSVLQGISMIGPPVISNLASIPAGEKGPVLTTTTRDKGLKASPKPRPHGHPPRVPLKERPAFSDGAKVLKEVIVNEASIQDMNAHPKTLNKSSAIQPRHKRRMVSTTPLYPSAASPKKERFREVRDVG